MRFGVHNVKQSLKLLVADALLDEPGYVSCPQPIMYWIPEASVTVWPSFAGFERGQNGSYRVVVETALLTHVKAFWA
jgi:hypothetical protein